MTPRTSHSDPSRSLLGLSLFAALSGLTTGQSPVPNQVFSGAERGTGFSVNQDGSRGALLSNSTLVGPARIAPDGTPWAVAIVTTGGSPTAVAYRTASPSVYTPGFIAQNLPGSATCLTVTAESHALVGTDGSALVELDRTSSTPVRTTPLSGPASAIEVDELGRAWIGIRNMPNPVLQRIDRPSGASSIVTIQGVSSDIVRILPDGRAGGSHVFVSCAGIPALFEYDSALNFVARHDLPGTAVDATLSQLELATDGSIWILVANAGIWRFQPASGTFEAKVAADRIESIAFDAHGTLWRTDRVNAGSFAEVGPIDVPTLAFGSAERIPGATGVARMQDGAGLFIAQVIDQTGDSDGDGFANRVEIDARSNPFDAASTPVIDLQARLDVPAGQDLVVRLRGNLGVGVVALGTQRVSSPIQIPGILGGFGLDPNRVLGAPVNVLVPGELRIPVPIGIGDARLYAQAMNLPVVGSPRFSDVAPINLRRSTATSVVEPFNNAVQFDSTTSAARWGNGALRATSLGGRGLLGVFDPTAGQQVAPDTWLFDTDHQVFPGSQTLFGSPVIVTDGVFEFAKMEIPAGTTVLFRGSKPAVIRVRGDLRIDGTLDCNGEGVARGFNPTSVFDPIVGGFVGAEGQAGAAGGPGGGSGGMGGVGCLGNGQTGPSTGADGDAIQVSGGSGYANATGRMATAGQGALPFPLDGQTASIVFRLFNSITCQMGAGGSGGAFLGAGSDGLAIQSPTMIAADLGPPTAGGGAVPFLLPPNGISSLEHFLVGGAGGGGGGSHPVNLSTQQIRVDLRAWHSGGGGNGGGGALALRVGDELVVGANGRVSARGGSGPLDSDRTQGPAMPGGGGSGGSILIQMHDASFLRQNGTLDVSGGDGSRIDFVQFNGQHGISEGGDGGHGLVRLEAGANANANALGQVDGPPSLGTDNAGTLTDQDTWTGAQSLWYRVSSNVPPRWELFRVMATFNGLTLTFSDDPNNGPSPNLPGQPIRFYVQGGRLDPATGAVVAAGPFRGDVPTLNQDAATHVRFVVLFDRSVDPNCQVDRVEIVAR